MWLYKAFSEADALEYEERRGALAGLCGILAEALKIKSGAEYGASEEARALARRFSEARLTALLEKALGAYRDSGIFLPFGVTGTAAAAGLYETAVSKNRRNLMTEIIGVKFKGNGKVYYFDPCGIKASIDDKVVVETARGVELGDVAIANREVADSEITPPLKKTLRLATPEDIAVGEANRAKEKEAFDLCLSCIQKHKLEMSLVEAEYTFDGSKLLFYFTADGRVDFRELVKELASIFRTRIELRQIGVRDEAKMLGGIGICGRPFCCSTFLEDFHPVSIKMAKEQSLSLNPAKISGACGRLMCCLKYEQAAYEDLYRRTPGIDSVVETPDGKGTVVDFVLLKGLLKVKLDRNPDAPPATYTVEACKVLVPGKGRKDKPSVFEGEE